MAESVNKICDEREDQDYSSECSNYRTNKVSFKHHVHSSVKFCAGVLEMSRTEEVVPFQFKSISSSELSLLQFHTSNIIVGQRPIGLALDQFSSMYSCNCTLN